MDLATLRQRFHLPGITFDDQNGLARVSIATQHATATIYLQGAHLAAWQPTGFQPVIFMSRQTDLTPGKPLRGGIPVVFPWFSGDKKKDRIDGHPGPSHGFARTQNWTVASIRRAGPDILLSFELGATPTSRALGYDHFQLRLDFRIGRALGMALTVTNAGLQPLSFEDCLHTYFFVTDVHEASVLGLEPTPYIDKTDANQGKPATGQPIRFTATTDRIYANTEAPITILDGAGHRRILLRRTNSRDSIVWNPWDKLVDLGPWEWHEMLAIETANVNGNAITLAPTQHHTMESHITVEKT